MKDYENRLVGARTLYEELLASQVYKFADLKAVNLPEVAGVYIIWISDTEEALYVGRTNIIRRRLYTNHLMGNKSTARLKKYIVEDNVKFSNITDYVQAKIFLFQTGVFNLLRNQIVINRVI